MALYDMVVREDIVNFKEHMNYSSAKIQMKSSTYSETVELLKEEFLDYCKVNSVDLNDNLIIEAFVEICIELSNRNLNEKDLRYGVKELISIFNDDKSKGQMFYYLFIYSAIYDKYVITKIIIQLLKVDFNYLVKKDAMRLIDEEFVAKLIVKHDKLFNFYYLYNYFEVIEFKKENNSIKNALLLIGFAATRDYYRYLMSKSADYKDMIFYNYFRNKDNFLLSLVNKNEGRIYRYIKPYMIHDYKIYTTNISGVELHGLYATGSSYKTIYEFVKESQLEEVNNGINNNINMCIFNMFMKNDFIENDDYDNFFSKDSFSKVNDDDIVTFLLDIHQYDLDINLYNNILESLNLSNNTIIQIYGESNKDIKKSLEKKFPSLMNDFMAINEIKEL